MGDRLATIDTGRNLGGGGGIPPLGRTGPPINNNVGGTEAYLHAKFHLDPSNRLAAIRQRHRKTDRQTGQRSDGIGRTVLQRIAQKRRNML